MVSLATTRYVLLWRIWKWKNKVVHSPLESRNIILNEDIMESLKSLSFLWLSNRKKKTLILMELSRQNRNQQVVVDVEEEIVSEYSFKSTQEEFQRDEAEDGKEGDESLEGETKRKSKLSEEDGETYK
ncbi:uncharacterized protein [Rutidosis leptorrhynchoides]|uniref:uncharacterized protein n=1 Tax=Rutidosis leptorrhynchoides TaxID=125765 RepID=UPI003A9A0D67